MTIGIGFKCSDGIVLATDSQYTRGAYKGHGPKLFDLFALTQHPTLSALVAGAGRVSFMKMAIGKLEDRLIGIVDPSLADIQNEVEDTLLDFYKKHIYPIPASEQRAAVFDLILGVWTKRGGFGLFKTDGTAITQEIVHGNGYCGIGSGLPLSTYALDLSCQPAGMTVENAKFLAAFGIKAAKDYVWSCGGRTHIRTLKDDGSGFLSHRVIPVEVEDAERYSEELFETLRVIIDCLDTEATWDEDSVNAMTNLLKESIINFRDKQIEKKERIRKARQRARPTPDPRFP